MALKRFFLDQDQSSHWYVIPLARRAEWDKWCDIPEDNEAAWTAPVFVQEVGGGPNCVTFSQPEIA